MEVNLNTKNNRRRKESQEKIERAFVELLQTQEMREIKVSDIISITGLNRSTFYANYVDVYDLAEKVMTHLENDFSHQFNDFDYRHNNGGALKMFRHIYDNQLFYKTYFKLTTFIERRVSVYDESRAEIEFQNKNIAYHIEFFRNGLNSIIKMWLDGGCQESPEEMADILKREYKGRNL